MVYAPWGRRTLAAVIDFLLMQPYFIVGSILSAVIGGSTGHNLLYFCAGLGIWANFYNKCILMGKFGRSWGKQLMGFQLLSETTQAPMGVWRAVVREAAHMADILTLGIGYLMPIWDGKRQTFADKIMKTITIDDRATVRAETWTPQETAYAR